MHYELGEGIQGEFVESWKYTLHFYTIYPERNLPKKHKIIHLIQEIIDRGFDKTIRAGLSVSRLILSRSRRYGLEDNQPFLTLDFKDNGVHLYSEKGKIDQLESIELNEQILNLIRVLEKEEIN